VRALGNRLAGAIFTAVFASVALGGAAAQLSSEQQSALRANCRGDFMSKCSGVKPGGKEALTCLQTNVSNLSAGCKAVVSSTLPKEAPKEVPAAAAPPVAPPPAPARATAAPPPVAPAAPAPVTAAPPPPAAPAQATVVPAAPAAPPPAPPKAATAKPPAKPARPAVTAAPAPPTAEEQSAMRSACRSDFMSHCSGVAPGGKEALACLQKNVGALSPSCRTVVSATIAAPKPAPAVAVAAPPPAAPPPVAATPEQLSAVKFTCSRDFKRYCNGIQPGGPEALGCLQRNAPRLTANCRTALADIADEMPPPVPAAIAAPPPAPAAPRPSAVNAVVMLRACRLDLLRHCRGIEPGGGRELACLAAHEGALTARCKVARGVTAPLR
jgi:hypothetical protein